MLGSKCPVSICCPIHSMKKVLPGCLANVRVLKEAKSAANQMGRERFLCEAYGGGGWNMSLKDFKRHSDWLNVMGVNFMNQHLAHMSFVGVRKYDWPPMFVRWLPGGMIIRY